MNIEITFLDSFPPLEKLTKDTDIFIQIKAEKYNLRKLVESKQDILIKNIKDQLLLKLLTKDNNILGINTFNPLKYKELFSFDQKPILHWLDFKKEKNHFTNNKNSNFFLYEYIRLKIKITPFIVSNLNLTYEESLNNLNNSNFTINKNRNLNQNMKSTFEKSLDNNSKATTMSNNSNIMKKKILNLKKKTKISLNYYPTKQKFKKNNNNYNSTRNISFLHRSSKNNTLIPKPSKNGEAFYLSSYNNNNNNKRRNILKASVLEKPDKNTDDVNHNDYDKKEEEKKLEKNKLSMYGEQLLLNETDEVLNKNIVNNREISKENIFLYINDNSINDNNNNDDSISNSNNKEIYHINSASLLKNKINKKINSKINPFKKNNFSYYAGYVPSYNGGLMQEMNFLPRNHDYTIDNSNIFNLGNHKSLNNLNIVNGLNSLTEPGKSKSNNETAQFNTLKNDFELFYTQNFIKSIENDVILFEFNLFLKKSISLLYAYNTEFTILSKKNKSLNNSLDYYRKEIKLLKKKKRKLLTMKEDNEFKMKNIELSKESKFALVEGIKNQNSFKNNILYNMFPNKKENIFKDIDKSLISIIQNLIKTKFNSFVDGRNKQKLKEEQNKERYKTISGYDDKGGNNLKEDILNKDELNKSMKAREIIGISTEEKKQKSVNENNLNKNQNNNTKEGLNKSNKIFKTKSINIKKHEKYSKNNSKYILPKAKSKRNINKNSITSKLLEIQKK